MPSADYFFCFVFDCQEETYEKSSNTLYRKDECYGCKAYFAIRPKEAISMVNNGIKVKIRLPNLLQIRSTNCNNKVIFFI